VADKLRNINQLVSIILEPEGHNTSPVITLAANIAMQSNKDADPLLLILAADHVVQDEAAFTKAVNQALPLVEFGKLVTFGIVQQLAHTDYGLIERGDEIKNGFTIKEFVEKSNAKTA
jgi:mannose-1-phosphate guanylyltransferase